MDNSSCETVGMLQKTPSNEQSSTMVKPCLMIFSPVRKMAGSLAGHRNACTCVERLGNKNLAVAAFPPIEALVAADKKLPKGSILMVSSLLPVRQIPICKGTQQMGWGGVGLGIGG